MGETAVPRLVAAATADPTSRPGSTPEQFAGELGCLVRERLGEDIVALGQRLAGLVSEALGVARTAPCPRPTASGNRPGRGCVTPSAATRGSSGPLLHRPGVDAARNSRGGSGAGCGGRGAGSGFSRSGGVVAARRGGRAPGRVGALLPSASRARRDLPQAVPPRRPAQRPEGVAAASPAVDHPGPSRRAPWHSQTLRQPESRFPRRSRSRIRLARVERPASRVSSVRSWELESWE